MSNPSCSLRVCRSRGLYNLRRMTDASSYEAIGIRLTLIFISNNEQALVNYKSDNQFPHKKVTVLGCQSSKSKAWPVLFVYLRFELWKDHRSKVTYDILTFGCFTDLGRLWQNIGIQRAKSIHQFFLVISSCFCLPSISGRGRFSRADLKLVSGYTSVCIHCLMACFFCVPLISVGICYVGICKIIC